MCDSTTPGQPSETETTPRDLKVRLAEQKLMVTWQDGLESAYDLAVLRRECPCAVCRLEREARAAQPRGLTILKTDPVGIRATGAHLVGRYAIQFTWSDGHSSGIYEFGSLRAMGAGK